MPYKRPRKRYHRIKVKRSNAGLGLYAGNVIEKNDFIVEYHGPLMNEEESDDKGGKYQFALDKKWTIDGSSHTNLARYINHSCKPNCEPEIDGKRIFVYAIKNIHPGEEITYNYGKEYFNDFIKPYGCKCGNHRAKFS